MQKREFPKSGLAALGDLGFLGAARAGGPAVTKKVSDVRRDEEWDTVIVDSGIAATFVENEALDRGLKKVIMIEKMLVFGGNSESPIPNRNGANSKAQARMCGLLRRRNRETRPDRAVSDLPRPEVVRSKLPPCERQGHSPCLDPLRARDGRLRALPPRTRVFRMRIRYPC